MTRTIQLTRGQVAIVDDEDYEQLSKHSWYCHRSSDGSLSACRRDKQTRRLVIMHREIAGAPHDKVIDHRDGNTLNNTRANLRICTQSENNMNKRLASNNTSGAKGVHWHKQISKWQAMIKKNGRRYFLGSYANIEDAIRAYRNAEDEMFGEYSYRLSR